MPDALFDLQLQLEPPCTMPSHHTTDGKHLTQPLVDFPSSFSIGSHKLSEPLVDIASVKAHLALLGAFASLKERIETCAPDNLPDSARGLSNTPEAPQRWIWFVTLAVERYAAPASTLTI